MAARQNPARHLPNGFAPALTPARFDREAFPPGGNAHAGGPPGPKARLARLAAVPAAKAARTFAGIAVAVMPSSSPRPCADRSRRLVRELSARAKPCASPHCGVARLPQGRPPVKLLPRHDARAALARRPAKRRGERGMRQGNQMGGAQKNRPGGEARPDGNVGKGPAGRAGELFRPARVQARGDSAPRTGAPQPRSAFRALRPA